MLGWLHSWQWWLPCHMVVRASWACQGMGQSRSAPLHPCFWTSAPCWHTTDASATRVTGLAMGASTIFRWSPSAATNPHHHQVDHHQVAHCPSLRVSSLAMVSNAMMAMRARCALIAVTLSTSTCIIHSSISIYWGHNQTLCTALAVTLGFFSSDVECSWDIILGLAHSWSGHVPRSSLVCHSSSPSSSCSSTSISSPSGHGYFSVLLATDSLGSHFLRITASLATQGLWLHERICTTTFPWF